MSAAYTDADVAALTSVTCRAHHGLGAPQQPCYGCRSDAARLLDAVASGIAARTLRDAADAYVNVKGGSSKRPVARTWLRDRADLLERS